MISSAAASVIINGSLPHLAKQQHAKKVDASVASAESRETSGDNTQIPIQNHMTRKKAPHRVKSLAL